MPRRVISVDGRGAAAGGERPPHRRSRARWEPTRSMSARIRRRLVRVARTATVLAARRYRGGPGPCLVLAPHADDESLGCGGTIAAKRSAGIRVVVAVVTDGSLSDRDARHADVVAQVRRREALAACGVLGVSPDDVRFVGLPDGSLEGRHDELVECLNHLLAEVRPCEVLVCSWMDPHPDHVALNRAIAQADLGGALVRQYLVWAWPSWPLSAVRMLRTGPHADGSTVRRAARLLVSLRRSHVAPFRSQKAMAIRLYESQAGDGGPGRGVPAQMMSQFAGRFELLVDQDADPRRSPK